MYYWFVERFFSCQNLGLLFVKSLGAACIAMEIVRLRCWGVAFLSCSLLLCGPFAEGLLKVRGVNLGGWLVVEGWIKPSLFDDIPNGDMLDGTQVQFKSVTLQKYVSADDGGGLGVTVGRNVPSSWETFKLWRVSEGSFYLRCYGGQFLTFDIMGSNVSATVESSTMAETFLIERYHNRVHIKSSSGTYVQATSETQLTGDYQGQPGWDDNAATFEMNIIANDLHGDYQLANGYGPAKAKAVLKKHRSSFVTAEDFRFLSHHGINTVRIPVGWWIAEDPNPPDPFVGGSLVALDNAFSWAQAYNLKCIIDLHAAPGSQNGMEHSASRDGSADWAMSPEYISKSLNVIDFLASRYANHPALLGIELLNEPSASNVPFDIMVSYYSKGYQIVRKYSLTSYVIICQRIGTADPLELYKANIGLSNIVVDLHYYNLFNEFFKNMSAVDNIQFIYESRQSQVRELNSANGPLLFIGEWVNEWNVENSSQMLYRLFGRAQLQAYDEASFGWAYWTLKNARKHWDFEWNIKNSYLDLGPAASNEQIPDIGLLLLLIFGSLYLLITV